jgi:hypothetical protein
MSPTHMFSTATPPIPSSLLAHNVTGHQLDHLGRCKTLGDVLAANGTTVLVFLRHYG